MWNESERASYNERASMQGAGSSPSLPQGLGAKAEQYNAPAAPRDKGSLEREIDAYGNGLDQFERLLTNLATRVQSVSRPSEPRGNGQGKAIPSPASPIAAYVQNHNQRFEGLLEALSFITERIDL